MLRVFAFAALALAFAAPAFAQSTLTASEYAARGVPPVDRPWTAQDYPYASAALRDLRAGQLPRTNAPESAAILDRLTDVASLTSCRDIPGDLRARMLACSAVLRATSEILQAYADVIDADPRYGEDAIRIIAAALQSAAVTNDLFLAFAETLDPNDPRRGALGQAADGLAQMMNGAIQTLTQRDIYPPHARVYLAGVIADIYPRLAPSFSAEARAPLEAELSRLARRDSNRQVRDALAAFAS